MRVSLQRLESTVLSVKKMNLAFKHCSQDKPNNSSLSQDGRVLFLQPVFYSMYTHAVYVMQQILYEFRLFLQQMNQPCVITILYV